MLEVQGRPKSLGYGMVSSFDFNRLQFFDYNPQWLSIFVALMKLISIALKNEEICWWISA